MPDIELNPVLLENRITNIEKEIAQIREILQAWTSSHDDREKEERETQREERREQREEARSQKVELASLRKDLITAMSYNAVCANQWESHREIHKNLTRSERIWDAIGATIATVLGIFIGKP